MYGSDWNWCDAVSAIGTLLTPIFGLGVVNKWFERRRIERVEREESINMSIDEVGVDETEDTTRAFWGLIQKSIPELQGKALPTRRFWSMPYKRGINFVYVVLESAARVELYIDNGVPDWNLRVYDELKREEETIKNRLPDKYRDGLVWFGRPHSRAKGVSIEYGKSGIRDSNRWNEVVEFFAGAAPALKKAVSQVIERRP